MSFKIYIAPKTTEESKIKSDEFLVGEEVERDKAHTLLLEKLNYANQCFCVLDVVTGREWIG